MLPSFLSGERVIVDNGYSNPRYITPRNVDFKKRRLHSVLRARNETVNERLKNFNSVKAFFRHDLEIQGTVFHAVARLTALMINYRDPLFKE